MNKALKKEKNNSKNGFATRIVKGETRPSEIITLFYNPKLSDEEKIEIGIRKGYVIPKDFVQIVRNMYLNDKLKGNKMYSISPGFDDPLMRPLKTHPQYEHNPIYKREYPRRIQKPDPTKMICFMPASYVEAMKSTEMERVTIRQKYQETFFPRYLKLRKQKQLMRKKMKIPRFKENNASTSHQSSSNSNDQTNSTKKEMTLNFEFDSDVRVNCVDMKIGMNNNQQIVKYSSKNDFPEPVEQKITPVVDVVLPVVALKTDQEKAEYKREMIKKYTPMLSEQNLKGIRAALGGPSLFKQLRKNLDEKQRIERLKIVQEPIESGGEFDRKIIERLRMKSKIDDPIDSLDGEKSLHIVTSDEEEEDENMEGIENTEPVEAKITVPVEHFIYIKDFDGHFLLYTGNVEREIEVQTDYSSEDLNELATTSTSKVQKPSSISTQSSSNSIMIPPNISNIPSSSTENLTALTIDILANSLSLTANSLSLPRKKSENPWEDIVNDADELFIRKSASHSIVSSTPSALELEQNLSKMVIKPRLSTTITLGDEPTTPLTSTPPASTVVEKPKGKRGRPHKRPRGPQTKNPLKRTPDIPYHPNDDPLLKQSGPLDPSILGRKRPGRPRIHFKKAEDSTDSADIVVESALPAPQPHQFPRPDLEPFQAEVQPKLSDCRTFIMPKSPGPRFARPDINRFVADCAKSSSSLQKPIESQDDVLSQNSISCDSEGPSTKRSKNDTDDQQSNSSSLCPPPTRPIRSRRSYISKNNPKLRHRRTEELTASASGEHPEESSDDAISRTSTQSWMQNRMMQGNSRTSSIAEDFDELAWPTRNVSTFGDPQPPPEVTIDEEIEAKPDTRDLPTPPPINEFTRKSWKNKNMDDVKQEITEEELNELQVMFENIQPKPEISEDEIMLVDAAYQVPRNYPVPVDENDNLPPKNENYEGERIPHWFTINKFVYHDFNNFFMSDPEVFENLVLCLLEDENDEGMTFRQSIEYNDRAKPYSEKFFEFLKTSPRNGGVSCEDFTGYNGYTGELRKRCAQNSMTVTFKTCYGAVEMATEVNDKLETHMTAFGVLGINETEILKKALAIFTGRYVKSTLKLAKLYCIPWATTEHKTRRWEVMISGWSEFIKRGGYLRLIFDLTKIEGRRKPGKEFVDEIERILNNSVKNMRNALEIFNLDEEGLEAKIAERVNISAEQLEMIRNDMSTEKTEKHQFACETCLQTTGSGINNKCHIYFSTPEILNLHEKMHQLEECGECFENTSYLSIHCINKHYSSL
ncbi:unnamed protein product [Caenorhabditis angaria]|uniref:Uncharacterized protein n=1 Tax=Caenorhabditis angaria TaxID=860376 RepID=A0A9P1IY37_9PELO|nr:unnamed protein product [Caenorhabditis angaria]